MNKVLYLDNQIINLEVFKGCFEDQYEIFVADTAQDASNIIKKNEIKVLITDQRMPDVEGLDFIIEVKRQQPNLSCIILTAYPDPDLLLSALNKAEVFRFLVKPWLEYDLRQTIDKAIETYDAKEEKKKLIEELTIAKYKAEESDRLKSAFLSNLSHEIRTPMNGILGFSNLLNNPELTDIQRNKYVGIIQAKSQHLMNIITDIIDISKIEAGQLKVNNLMTNINNMLTDLIALYQVPAKKKNIQLIVHKSLTDHESEIYTDYTKLRQVLENLVGNALKFTDKGSIRVTYELKKEKLLFCIEDTGIGIHSDSQKIIFDSFSQVANSSTRLYGGTGLGLSISQAYVHELGGDIWLKSEPGKGTVFYFTIPYRPVTQTESIK